MAPAGNGDEKDEDGEFDAWRTGAYVLASVLDLGPDRPWELHLG